MFVSSTALKIVCELSLVGVVGLVAMLAFVVLTVDRLNVRLAELEAQLADLKRPDAPARGGLRHVVASHTLHPHSARRPAHGIAGAALHPGDRISPQAQTRGLQHRRSASPSRQLCPAIQR
jgi:hypothetical protein